MSILHEATIFFAATILAVPIARKLGLGSVLGYVIAGIVIGPWCLGLISDVDNILHFSEIGVVFMLFIIGLELQPMRLWVLRKSVFNLGGLQVLITAVVLSAVAWGFKLNLTSAILVGFALSLSSTAFALQMLAEKKELVTTHGKAAFGILLFQDLIVIPVMAIVPFLAVTELASGDQQASHLETILNILRSLGVMLLFLVGGHYLLRPILRIVAAAQILEVFTATALLLVLGSALLMESTGLSMGLGAFLAGVLVAGSEYRHQLEADVGPFKGLLLGLFFIAIGMSVNLGLLVRDYIWVGILLSSLIVIKFVILYVLGRLYGLKENAPRTLGAVLCQGGEFAFILFGLSVNYSVIEKDVADLLILVVTLSMTLTPLIVLFNERFLNKVPPAPEREFDEIEDTDHKVVIIGFGRFGQIISRMLTAKNIRHTALEINPGHIDFVRKFGNKVYYGDATRIDVLRAARVDKAKVVVLALHRIEESIRMAKMIRREFPNVKLFCRAQNRIHEMRLKELGVNGIIRDTLLSSIHLAGEIMQELGLKDTAVEVAKNLFHKHDATTLEKQFAVREDSDALIQTARESADQLKTLYETDDLFHKEK